MTCSRGNANCKARRRQRKSHRERRQNANSSCRCRLSVMQSPDLRPTGAPYGTECGRRSTDMTSDRGARSSKTRVSQPERHVVSTDRPRWNAEHQCGDASLRHSPPIHRYLSAIIVEHSPAHHRRACEHRRYDAAHDRNAAMHRQIGAVHRRIESSHARLSAPHRQKVARLARDSRAPSRAGEI
jgi:hypothetical protein